MNERWYCKLLLTAAMATLGCTVAAAEYFTDFEPPLYTGSPEGTVLTGQQGFYLPDASTPSTDWFVYTYAGNVLGLPPNPGDGGEQFAGGTGLGDGSYARAQWTQDGTFGDGTGLWTTSFDIAATFVGELPTNDNLGSFSTMPCDDPYNPDHATFIALARWTDPNTGTNWNADYLYYNAAGGYVIASVPDPGFQGLPINHWYRWSTTFDFDSNAITQLAITDLATGQTVTYEPQDWYLAGGGGGGLPAPIGFRLFAGTSSPYGNTLAFDNLAIYQCVGDVDGDNDTDHSDLGELLAAWCTQEGDPNWNPDADLDGDGHVGHGDLGILLADWGCPG